MWVKKKDFDKSQDSVHILDGELNELKYDLKYGLKVSVVTDRKGAVGSSTYESITLQKAVSLILEKLGYKYQRENSEKFVK
jgi:hypothetical protein